MHVDRIMGHAEPNASSNGIRSESWSFLLEVEIIRQKKLCEEAKKRPTWAQQPHNLLALTVGKLVVLGVDRPGQNGVRKRQTRKQNRWALNLA